MSLRVHVLAVLGIAPEEMRQGLGGLSTLEIRRSGDWSAVAIPTRHTSARTLLETACAQGWVHLLATTTDAVAWGLVLGAGPDRVFEGTHDASARFDTDFDKNLRQSLGASSSEIIRHLVDATYFDRTLISTTVAAAFNRSAPVSLRDLCEEQARRISLALDRLNVEHDRAGLGQVLSRTGDPHEGLGDEAGNLSDFLRTLGLVGVEELLQVPFRLVPSSGPTKIQSGPAAHMLDAGLPAVPALCLAGGGASIALNRLSRLLMLVLLLDDRAEAVLAVTPDGEDVLERLRAWKKLTPRGHAMAFSAPVSWRQSLEKLAATSRSLRVPDGTRIELLTAAPFRPACRVFQGAVDGGRWVVERCYPPLERDELQAALELVESIDLRRFVPARDAAEAERLQEMAQTMDEWGFYSVGFRGLEPVVQRLPEFRFMPGGGVHESWVRTVFKVRHQSRWSEWPDDSDNHGAITWNRWQEKLAEKARGT